MNLRPVQPPTPEVEVRHPTANRALSRARIVQRVLAPLAAAVLMAGLPAHAQSDLLGEAAELLRRQDPAGAYSLLVTQEPARAGEPRFDYLLGVAALDSGHVTRAIFALERAVAVSPGDARARAELARAYLVAGETDSARSELNEVRRSRLPEDVDAAIDRVLGLIEQLAPDHRRRFSGYVEFGGGHDTNVNSATNQGEFAIPAFGGLLFKSGAESLRQRDEFGSLAGGLSVSQPLDAQWKLVAATNVRATANRHVHEMSSDLADATLAVIHTDGASSQTVALQNSTAWVDSRVYRSANGVSLQWQRQLDPASQASAFAQWSRQEYAGQVERNTDRSLVGLGYARSVSPIDTLLFGSAYAAAERARDAASDFNGHHALGLRLGAEHRLGARSVAFLEWQHERRNYGGTDPLFDVRRSDRQDDLTAGLRFTSAAGWQLVPLVRHTRAASNVVLYDHTRTIFQVALRKEFQ